MKKISDQGIAPQFCFWLAAKERCLTKLLKQDDLRKRVARIAKWAKGLKEASANWNFEPNLGEYYHMCPDCIDAFEKYSGKNTGGITDGKKLEARFPEEYLAFKNAQMRSIMQCYAEFCHTAGIKSPSFVCSPHPRNEPRKQCCSSNGVSANRSNMTKYLTSINRRFISALLSCGNLWNP
ncbi:MAG: hypothetical protein V8T87_10350 [Victivallales bacterium]